MHAVLFDLDDTLLDRQAAFRRYASDLLARRGVDSPGALETLVELDARGRVDRETFAERVAARYPQLTGLAADFAARFASCVEPRPGVREALADLAATRPVAIVSNGSGTRQRAKLEAADLHDLGLDVLISGEVGAAKPDPRIFELAMAALNVPPSDIWFVGDHPDHDIVGAAHVGMQTCWVRRGQESSQAQDYATAVVDEIEQAFDLLGRQRPLREGQGGGSSCRT